MRLGLGLGSVKYNIPKIKSFIKESFLIKMNVHCIFHKKKSAKYIYYYKN